MNDLLSTSEVAALCGVTRRAVSEWIKLGKLPARLVAHSWVIDPADLEAALKAGRIQAAPGTLAEVEAELAAGPLGRGERRRLAAIRRRLQETPPDRRG